MIFGFTPVDFALFLLISLAICITVCALAMEAAVLFTPSFLFIFPVLFSSFPALSPNEAIGLAFIVEVFGYTSSVSGYWYRGQIDFTIAGALVVVTVPLAIAGRLLSYVVPSEGLLVLFGVLLLGLAWIIYRYHPDEEAGTCRLCGDAIYPLINGDSPTDETAEDSSRTNGGEATPKDHQEGDGLYPPRRSLLDPRENASKTFPLGWVDRVIVGAGGAFAGLVGIAIGEVSNTFLTVRKRLPIKLTTGTSALILHLTILSALLTNLVILWIDPSFIAAEELSIPWTIGAILAPVVVLGGQIGSLLNNRLSDRTVVQTMIGAYALVGSFVIGRTLVL
jgi:uncharacterized membrane protein YfcA